MARILIIEDDPDINNILYSLLTEEGFDVSRALSGSEAAPLIRNNPDLILMDLMLPDTTGEELLKTVSPGIPVIAVSARSGSCDKVSLLSLGCVDYVTKPFDHEELLARIKVALRFKKSGAKLTLGNLTMDESSHSVLAAGNPVRLTPTEYAIIKVLLTNHDHVISRSELLEKACEYTPDLVEESLKVHMSNLRRKLKQAGSDVEIEAVWGIGFRLTIS